MIILKT